MGLGFFIPEKDGLISEYQALHRTFTARAEEKEPPSTPTTQWHSLKKTGHSLSGWPVFVH
jgi:hypothetical protein